MYKTGNMLTKRKGDDDYVFDGSRSGKQRHMLLNHTVCHPSSLILSFSHFYIEIIKT